MFPNKLLFVASDIRQDSQWLKRLILASVDRGFITNLVLIGEVSEWEELRVYTSQLNVEVCYMPRKGKSRALLNLFLATILLFRIKPQIVHTHGYFASIFFLPTSFFLRSPIRLHDRHYGCLHHIYKKRHSILIDKLLSLFSTQIITHSESTRRSISRLEFVDLEKIVNVYLGVETCKFMKLPSPGGSKLRKDLGIGEDSVLIGTNARAESWKGLSAFLSAAEILYKRNREYVFVMINVDKMQELFGAIEKLAQRVPLHYLSNVSDVADFYRAIDVFCHVPVSEYAEPAGLVYVEAILSGVPCVFTKSGIANDFQFQSSSIRFINYNDVPALCESIEEMSTMKNRVLPKNRGIPVDIQKMSIENYIDSQFLVYKEAWENKFY